MIEINLPSGWIIVKLDDLIVRMTNGANVTQYEEPLGLPISRIETIWNETIDFNRVKFIKENEIDFVEKYRLLDNDILFSHINSDSHIGKTAIFRNLKNVTLIHGINLLLLRPSSKISALFLNYQLKFLRYKGAFSAIAQKAVNQSSINQGKLKSFDIKLPPIDEQKRIVSKIEELFSELDKGIETLKTAKQQLKIYRQAVLKYAFEGKLTNPGVKEGELPEGWVKINVKDFAKSIQYGYTESSNKVKVGPKFLRITDIQDNKVIWDTVPYCKIKESEKGKYLLQDGDLVFARTGATVGKSFLIKGDIPESVFASYLIRVRFPKEVNDFYVWYYFQSPFYWKQIIDKSVGTGQPNVNGTKLGDLEVAFPINLKDQLFIVQEIESRLSVCDKIEESIEQGLQQAEALRQSILKKAFEGKLVPQNPNDEPASVLLERIKSERQKLQPEKKIKIKKVKA